MSPDVTVSTMGQQNEKKVLFCAEEGSSLDALNHITTCMLCCCHGVYKPGVCVVFPKTNTPVICNGLFLLLRAHRIIQ